MQTLPEIQLPALGSNMTADEDSYLGERDSNGRKSGFGELFYANNQTAFQGTVLVLASFRLQYRQF